MTENDEQQDQPGWFIDEGIPGPGQRPDWLPEKFRSVAELSKSYSELEKRVGIAPDKYDFSKSRYLDPDYVPFQELQDLAREKRVPQDIFDKMLESVDKYMDEFSISQDDEMKKLGDNVPERIATLDNWAKANLSRDGYERLSGSLTNADSILALEEIRGKFMSNAVQVPTDNGEIPGAVTVDEMKKELATNIQKYSTDESYRKDFSRRLEVAAKNEPGYVDKVGA